MTAPFDANMSDLQRGQSSLFELVLAYRALGMDYETGNGADLFVYDLVTFGPEIGFLFHF